MEADKDGDGKLSFEEFAQMVSNTVRYSPSPISPIFPDTYLPPPGHCETNDTRRHLLTHVYPSHLSSRGYWLCIRCIIFLPLVSVSVSISQIRIVRPSVRPSALQLCLY